MKTNFICNIILLCMVLNIIANQIKLDNLDRRLQVLEAKVNITVP